MRQVFCRMAERPGDASVEVWSAQESATSSARGGTQVCPVIPSTGMSCCFPPAIPPVLCSSRPSFLIMLTLRPRRHLSGCAALKVNPEAALYVLDAFLDPSRCIASPSPSGTSIDCKPHPDPVAHLATQPELARAHSCAAHAHYQKFVASDAERDVWASVERHYSRRQSAVRVLVDASAGGAGYVYGAPRHASLQFALHHASESARLGLVSAIVLRVGFVAREIGEGFGVDFRVGRGVGHGGRTSWKRYRPLWRAVDDRLDELYAKARNASEATAAATAYVCGAEGCARTCAKSSASFKACAGRCPADLKPRYCSKQCQVKVRLARVFLRVRTLANDRHRQIL